jgi:hypothetical protein
VEQTDDMLKIIKTNLKDVGSLHIGSLNWSVIQTILSIGDNSLSNILEKMAYTQGRYQDWVKVLGNPMEFLENLNQNENLSIPLPLT